MTPPPERSEKSGTRLLDVATYVLLAFFVLLTLGPALIGRGALMDLDALTRFAPFSALHGINAEHTIVCRSDTLNYYLPGITAIKRAFLSGDFPTWAPYEMGGTPLASLPNHAALNPLSLPYFLMPVWLAPAFVKLGEFAVAIGGMFGFLRRLGLGRAASVLAGIIFATSGFMLMWTNWPHTRVAAFIPALFWGLERMVQQRRTRDVALVAVVFASMLLGGFPAVVLFALTLAGPYVLVRAFTRYGAEVREVAGVIGRASAGILLGVGLAAIQILPFARNLGAIGLDDRQSTGVHLPLGLFLTTVVPDSVSTCAGGWDHGPINPIEAIGFLGAAAAVLVLCAVFLPLPRGTAPDRSPRAFFAVALVAVVVVVWMGGPLLAVLQKLPFYSSNSITRAQSVFGFIGAVLAGIGIDRVVRGAAARRAANAEGGAPGSSSVLTRGNALRLAGLLAVLVFGILVLLRASSDASRDDYLGHLHHALVVPFLYVLGAVVAVLLCWFGRSWLRLVGAIGLVVLVVVQSTLFARTMLPLSNPDNLYPVTPTHRYLKANLGEDRWASSGLTLIPATADWYELRTPLGHEFAQSRWWDMLLAADPDAMASPTYSVFTSALTLPRVGESHILDQLSVRYWVASAGTVQGTPDPQTPGADRIVLRGSDPGHCSVRGGPQRGVLLRLVHDRAAPVKTPAVLHVAVHTPDGVVQGSRLVGPKLAAGPQRVAVAGEDLPEAGRFPVDVWLTGAPGRTVLRGTGTTLDCAAIRPIDDKLRLAFTESGATVYKRLGSLPRIRWASTSEVVPSAKERIAELKAGVPDDTVLLDDDSTPAAAGAPADVRVTSDIPERISTTVDAQGRGYLVVADAIVRPGWNATVDGHPVRVVHGNHAFGAVPVPEGKHQVVLEYDAPGLTAGKVITAGSVLVVLGLLIWPSWRRRRRRGRGEPEVTLRQPVGGA